MVDGIVGRTGNYYNGSAELLQITYPTFMIYSIYAKQGSGGEQNVIKNQRKKALYGFSWGSIGFGTGIYVFS